MAKRNPEAGSGRWLLLSGIGMAVFLSLAALVPGAAQAGPEDWARAMENCQTEAYGSQTYPGCDGVIAEACAKETGNSDSLKTRTFCIGAERDWWVAEMRRILEGMQDEDGQLAAVQRDWEAYRDADCAYAVAKEGPDFKSLYAPLCELELTRERALRLHLHDVGIP
ncbi:lysozyme inhibitor LprI family protein [Pseudogemmobacter bohemicus]|uniref:lysozyme inhibitor LprI family protein n=1 Tax=Pseudogemmobacter bohemicus TaxID=2250708 RepID=UPI00130086A2|nr:lysozyme inhibitor LprI family protein [Pseudogemmobacter bohemicus]